MILQISENAVKYHGSLEPIALATLAIARASEFPVAVHLDHAESVDLIHEAVELGFTSVMFDGSTLDYDANVALTAELAAYCHAHGVGIEAELGEVGGRMVCTRPVSGRIRQRLRSSSRQQVSMRLPSLSAVPMP